LLAKSVLIISINSLAWGWVSYSRYFWKSFWETV